MSPEQIAKVCHDANMSFCQVIGDNSQVPWEQAPEWQRESAVKGVVFLKENPAAHPSSQHESWMDEKLKAGWKYGPVKDAEKKEHPCLVPYDQLPTNQKLKDHLFQGVVKALL